MSWQDIVKSVAPTIGTALGGPIAGIATKFIADKLLGKSDASEEEIANTILSANPEMLLKLKELDNQFKAQMKQLDIDVYKLETDDRASARSRQQAMNDWTPTVLAILIIILYGVSFYIIFQKAVDLTESQKIAIFNLNNMVMLVLAYYFGSSHGSRIKDFTNIKK